MPTGLIDCIVHVFMFCGELLIMVHLDALRYHYSGAVPYHDAVLYCDAVRYHNSILYRHIVPHQYAIQY